MPGSFSGPGGQGGRSWWGQVQEVQVTVKGGYSPSLIRVRENVPLRIVFDRQESGECTSRVVFPDFALNRALPALVKTTVEFTPDRSGPYGFACGMNMVHGTLIVEPSANEDPRQPALRDAAPASAPADGVDAVHPTPDGDADVAERRAEIADLTRRVILGAVLTAPVLVPTMVGIVVPANLLPAILTNHWLQLALISPVMFYSGWPIHRIGWLSIVIGRQK